MTESTSNKRYPIMDLYGPIRTEFDPSTGGLVVVCQMMLPQTQEPLDFRVRFDGKATEELLSALPILQKEFGELVSLRANKGSLQ